MNFLLLGAGYGTRLARDILSLSPTDRSPYESLLPLPKPLIPINDIPLINYWITSLSTSPHFSLSNFYIITNNKFLPAFLSWRQSHYPNSFPVANILSDNTNDNDNRLGAIKDIEMAINHFHMRDEGRSLCIIGGDTLFFPDFDVTKVIDKQIGKGAEGEGKGNADKNDDNNNGIENNINKKSIPHDEKHPLDSSSSSSFHTVPSTSPLSLQNKNIVLWYPTVDTLKTGILSLHPPPSLSPSLSSSPSPPSVVIDFFEKPDPTSTPSRCACPCFYIFNAKTLERIEKYVKDNDHSLALVDAPGQLVKYLYKESEILALRISGRFDIGGLQSYKECDLWWRNREKGVEQKMPTD